MSVTGPIPSREVRALSAVAFWEVAAASDASMLGVAPIVSDARAKCVHRSFVVGHRKVDESGGSFATRVLRDVLTVKVACAAMLKLDRHSWSHAVV